MSLSDLEKRAVAKPIEAELDRQKEKTAKYRKKLKMLKEAAVELVDTFVYDHLKKYQVPKMERLKSVINEISE